jgi:hypothetical protein
MRNAVFILLITGFIFLCIAIENYIQIKYLEGFFVGIGIIFICMALAIRK